MAGTEDEASPSTGVERRWRWDVALSFAGAQRDYVRRVAVALKARGVRCFYDRDEQVRLWGAHLAEVLPQIYAKESAAVVVFISAEYVARDWTRLERRSALSRAVTEPGVYVLPARFDDSELPGLLPDVGVIDLRPLAPEDFAGLVAAKLAEFGSAGQLADGRPLSWESPPRLGGDVRNLLLAETEAAQLLPYQLLGLDSPPLPLIYVRQQLLQESVPVRSRDEDEAGETAGGRSVPANPERKTGLGFPVTRGYSSRDHFMARR
jgi:hypothetical protein